MIPSVGSSGGILLSAVTMTKCITKKVCFGERTEFFHKYQGFLYEVANIFNVNVK